MAELVTQSVLMALAEHAGAADAEPVWPAASWEEVRRCGALGWCIPTTFEGQGLEGVPLLEGYERLASACLTTCFILSQRDAACRRLRDSGNEVLQRELLPALARGECFATVGLSQLTTSRQHLKPSLTARLTADAVEFDGIIPWVSGAEHADYLIIGAMLDDGRQVLAVLPRQTPGVSVGPPLDLMALRGSLTAEVRCRQVVLDRRWLLAGPVERVLGGGRGGAGGLETSCLGLGLARAAIDYLAHEAAVRTDLAPSVTSLEQTWRSAWAEMVGLSQGENTPERAAALRGRANTLVLQATQTALTAGKGMGFLLQHPAQRWARQALFFLVWSCPRPATEATLAYLTPAPGPSCL